MASNLIEQLKNIINQYECGESNAISTGPCAPCCMVISPPTIILPTVPQPVKPLQLRSATQGVQNVEPQMTEEQALATRYANFYNNYNIDWHAEGKKSRKEPFVDPSANRCGGVTTDGNNPCCPKEKKVIKDENVGCPTGFKPCIMKLTPPCNGHPCGMWLATVQSCPPKKNKLSNLVAGPCKRPCCKHWKPKNGDCKYDDPCKAHCFNHPPGMKPKKRH